MRAGNAQHRGKWGLAWGSCSTAPKTPSYVPTHPHPPHHQTIPLIPGPTRHHTNPLIPSRPKSERLQAVLEERGRGGTSVVGNKGGAETTARTQESLFFAKA